MARPLRVEYPGAVYHVTSCGNGGEDVFLEDGDRLVFLEILSKTADRYGWLCHAYCLMGNHYHLLLETPDANLSRGMRQLNGVYTQHVNRRLRRAGHLFQGRFKAILLEKENHLLDVSRYVVLNPLRAGMAATVDEWPWSSYRGTVGLDTPLSCLETGWLLAHFDDNRETAIQRYRQFVADGITSGHNPLMDVRGQVLLGSQEFCSQFSPLLADISRQQEIPRSQRLSQRPYLESLFERKDRHGRNEAIHSAVNLWRYTQKEVADYLCLHYSTISRILALPCDATVATPIGRGASPDRKLRETHPAVKTDKTPAPKRGSRKREISGSDTPVSNDQLTLF